MGPRSPKTETHRRHPLRDTVHTGTQAPCFLRACPCGDRRKWISGGGGGAENRHESGETGGPGGPGEGGSRQHGCSQDQ